MFFQCLLLFSSVALPHIMRLSNSWGFKTHFAKIAKFALAHFFALVQLKGTQSFFGKIKQLKSLDFNFQFSQLTWELPTRMFTFLPGTLLWSPCTWKTKLTFWACDSPWKKKDNMTLFIQQQRHLKFTVFWIWRQHTWVVRFSTLFFDNTGLESFYHWTTS